MVNQWNRINLKVNPSGIGPEVLILDHDELWLAMHERRLTLAGLTFRSTQLAEEAIEIAKAYSSIKFVILEESLCTTSMGTQREQQRVEQELQDLQGSEVIRRIGSLRPDIQFIIVTSVPSRISEGDILIFRQETARLRRQHGVIEVIHKLDIENNPDGAYTWLITLLTSSQSDSVSETLTPFSETPIQFYSVFISYSSRDDKFIERLYLDLRKKDIRCWFAPEDLPIGSKIRSSIDEAIHIYDKLLLVLSESSINSQWVEQEVETALEREREQNRIVLFPVKLDDAVMNSKNGWTRLIKNSRNIGDFRHWKNYDAYQGSLKRLLRDLKAEG